MATLQIPIRNDLYHYRFRLELSGSFYVFAWHYNPPDASWYVDLFDDAGSPLVAGQRVKLSADLFKSHRYRDIPAGRIAVVDTQDQDQEPSLENFGGRVLVLYVEP